MSNTNIDLRLLCAVIASVLLGSSHHCCDLSIAQFLFIVLVPTRPDFPVSCGENKFYQSMLHAPADFSTLESFEEKFEQFHGPAY